MDRLEQISQTHSKRFTGGRYLECGDGWADLIEKFFYELDSLDPENSISIFVIKEKFGFLTILSDSCPDEKWDRLIILEEKYRALSKSVCEICGNKGKLKSRGTWLLTRCDSCLK